MYICIWDCACTNYFHVVCLDWRWFYRVPWNSNHIPTIHKSAACSSKAVSSTLSENYIYILANMHARTHARKLRHSCMCTIIHLNNSSGSFSFSCSGCFCLSIYMSACLWCEQTLFVQNCSIAYRTRLDVSWKQTFIFTYIIINMHEILHNRLMIQTNIFAIFSFFLLSDSYGIWQTHWL